MNRLRTLQDVVDWGLCTGCGACFYACSKQGVSLVNIEAVGIRPRFDSSSCAGCTQCLDICPGASVDAASHERSSTPIQVEADHAYGPALELWQGYATDPSIRYRASSGGLLTALALYCIEQEQMTSVLHTAMDPEKPWQNKTVMSSTREELELRVGSRYAPSSPCDTLSAIEESDGPCVFIGKPCDAAAVSKLRSNHPRLDHNLGLVLTFFCAGTPSTRGTLDLAQSMGVPSNDINSVQYRGNGWPGNFTVLHDNRTQQSSLSYAASWSYLTHYRSLRCNLCPDGLGQLADISCGDAWDQASDKNNPGVSLVLVRTERGRRILHGAIAADYVTVLPASSENVFAAQGNLLRRRKELTGRLLALQLFEIPVPTFRGFSLAQAWKHIPLKRKLRVFLGTVKRILEKRLYARGGGTQTARVERSLYSQLIPASHLAAEKAGEQ